MSDLEERIWIGVSVVLGLVLLYMMLAAPEEDLPPEALECAQWSESVMGRSTHWTGWEWESQDEFFVYQVCLTY